MQPNQPVVIDSAKTATTDKMVSLQMSGSKAKDAQGNQLMKPTHDLIVEEDSEHLSSRQNANSGQKQGTETFQSRKEHYQTNDKTSGAPQLHTHESNKESVKSE